MSSSQQSSVSEDVGKRREFCALNYLMIINFVPDATVKHFIVVKKFQFGQNHIKLFEKKNIISNLLQLPKVQPS